MSQHDETSGVYPRHETKVVSGDGDHVIFGCVEDDCGRLVSISRRRGFEVLEQGDFYAMHSGATGSLRMTGKVSQGDDA